MTLSTDEHGMAGDYAPVGEAELALDGNASENAATETPVPDRIYTRVLMSRESLSTSSQTHRAPPCHARRCPVIEVRWCLAHKGVAGNEKADEWAKIGAEKPGTRGVEWPNFPVRTEVWGAPATIPRQPQAGDLREEVGGGTLVGGGPNLQEEIPYAGQPKAQRRGSQQR